MYQFGFIGTGTMGGALARAACAGNDPKTVLLADSDLSRAQTLANELGCTAGSNDDAALYSRYLFLGVKPQVLPAVLTAIAPELRSRQDRFVLVSMAAGVKTERIRELTGCDAPIIRIMPNTAAAAGEGMILCCPTENVREEEVETFLAAMEKAGRFDRVPENLIDAGCAVSGCGPAYVYMLIEAMADGGVACGLPRDKAILYAAQTALGAATMVLETGRHPDKLKDEVCSPGGSTIMGGLTLEENGFRGAVSDAVMAAFDRTVELGK